MARFLATATVIAGDGEGSSRLAMLLNVKSGECHCESAAKKKPPQRALIYLLLPLLGEALPKSRVARELGCVL